MSKINRITLCIASMFIISYPLIDILMNICDLDNIGILSLVIMIIILIIMDMIAAFWLFVEWHDSFNLLHQERLKYTSPDLLGQQTKVCLGLHNSSSLYKITNRKRYVMRIILVEA